MRKYDVYIVIWQFEDQQQIYWRLTWVVWQKSNYIILRFCLFLLEKFQVYFFC